MKVTQYSVGEKLHFRIKSTRLSFHIARSSSMIIVIIILYTFQRLSANTLFCTSFWLLSFLVAWVMYTHIYILREFAITINFHLSFFKENSCIYSNNLYIYHIYKSTVTSCSGHEQLTLLIIHNIGDDIL